MAKSEMYKMPKYFRIYTSVKKIGDDYYEAEFEEYSDDGELHYTGIEDFCKQLLQSKTAIYGVYKYSGQVMHGAYREGYKMTECVGYIRISKSALKIKCGLLAARIKYGDDVVRIR